MQVDQILKKWEECLNRGDVSSIVKLYSREAILLGTFSEIIRDNPELIRKYFEELLSKEKLKVHFSLIRSRVYGGTWLCSGFYEFTYIENEQVSLPARFTFVIGNESDDNYRILEHHSSVVPHDT